MYCAERYQSDARRRGGALLAVLWLTAALSAIAFSVANTVRGETERTSTTVDSLRGYYLASGAVDRAILYMLWGPSRRNPDGTPRYWEKGVPRLYFNFPSGDTVVEIIPATAKLDLNAASERDLFRLLIAIGAEPDRAREIALGIIDWRAPGRGRFDAYYQALTPSFRARHASFEEIEEVLLVRGMTPELFYGSYVRDSEDRLIRRSGLADCISVYGSTSQFDVNTADPALLLSLGIHPDVVGQIVERRRTRWFRNMGELGPIRQFAGPGADRLSVGGITIYTLRATARRRLQNGQLSDMRRSVAATVKLLEPGYGRPYDILRWYDNAPTGTLQWQ